MTIKRSARPLKQPGRGRGVSAQKRASKKVAKKAPAKAKKAKPRKAPLRKARPRKLTLKQAYRKKTENRRAGVVKRKTTLGTTKVEVGPEPVAVDPADEVAVAGIARRQWAGRLSAVDRASHPPPATGIALVERVTRAVERELSQIEVIVGGHHVKPQQRTEAERRARTLASLARTLTELRKLRAQEHRVKPQDDRPRNSPEFRMELARRLDALVAEAKAVHPDEGD
jgi:hypothetical protein